jgi:hypothetical protein
MKIFNFVLYSLIFISISFCQGNNGESILTVFCDNNPNYRTDVILVQYTNNTFVLMGTGGASSQSADCVIKTKGVINGTKLSGYLTSVNTDITSYVIEKSSTIPFTASLINTTLDITSANVFGICGLNVNFEKKYFMVTGKNDILKKITDFIESIQGYESNNDLLPILKNSLSQNSNIPFSNSPGSKTFPQTNQPGIAQNSSFDALTAAHTKALTLYKNARKSEAAAVVVQFLKTNTIAEMVLTSESIGKYNDIGLFLEQGGEYTEGILVLKKVVELFPERTVAHLNIADAYKGINQIDSAKAHFSIYSDLMKKDGKESKIPKRVLEFLAQSKK